MNDTSRALSALNFLDSGCSYDEWIRIGMAAKSAGIAFVDWHSWSTIAENYKSEKDCRTTWDSFVATGKVTAGTLFYLAQEKGWQDTFHQQAYSKPSNKNRDNSRKGKTTHSSHAAPTALEVWERCLPVSSSHEYIVRKNGKSDGLRYYPESEPLLEINGKNVANYLVVPCWSKDILQTLQFIPATGGQKLNLRGASFKDGYFIVGDIKDVIYLCEGIGQAWAINKINDSAVVCFGSGRMMNVAKVLRAKYPKARIVVVPDRGKEKEACHIADAVVGQWLELPQDKPSNYDVNDYAQEFGRDELAHLMARLKAPVMRYKVLSGADLFNAPPMRWIVRGVLPVEGLAALYGASGSGKSFLILDMALSIAAGEDYWFGHRVTHAPVTYVCLEGEAGMGKRIKAWSLYFNKSLPDSLRFITQSFDLLSDDVSELSKAVIAAGGACGLVIIDTLNRAAPGADENSSVDMGKLIAAAKKLQNLIGGLVLLVHHTGKDATKGLRGHSSLYAALDGAIEVIKTETFREWSVAKSKDDMTGNVSSFKLEIVSVGIDDEGEEITSCVAVFDGSRKSVQTKKISLGSNQKIAFGVLGELLSRSVHIGKDGAPPDKPCIKYDEAVVFVAERMPADAKHRKTRSISAIAGLVGKKYLCMKGDWLWFA